MDSPHGKLDARTGVGLLSRNIKITTADPTIRWGGRIDIYGYVATYSDKSIKPIFRNGYAQLIGV